MSDSPDPDDLLLFTPVPLRRVQRNGWSAEVQRAFVDALSRTGVVAAAARSVGRSPRSAHMLRARAGEDSGFARAWDAALAQAGSMALDRARELGRERLRTPVIHRGRHVGWREAYDNRLLFAALRTMDRIADRRDLALLSAAERNEITGSAGKQGS